MYFLEFAYFGDLNARLAIRAGASAVVVDGATRDLNQTKSLNLPVFCLNYNAADVCKKATLDYINKPIKIQNELVNPGDLIFADECSLVIIYKKTENVVIERILNVLDNEKNIAKDILQNIDTKTILKNRGSF